MKPLKLKRRIGWRSINGEIVAINCADQKMVIWNEAASVLFEMLSKTTTLQVMVDCLVAEYGISHYRAKKDVLGFLKEAEELGFLNGSRNNNGMEHPGQVDGESVLLTMEMTAIEKLIPFAVTMETTYNCNENCIHCYMLKHLPSLPLESIKCILREIAEAGCLLLSLTGGEFFTRKDALEIVRYADNLHFAMDILSNGISINEAIAKELSECSVRRVQISLYGATPETHDGITRVKGSFRKTILAIQSLIAAGVKVEVACPLMRINFAERYRTIELAEAMGCIISPSHVITARNDGSKNTFDLRLDDGQMHEFLRDEKLSHLYTGRKPFQDHQLYLGFDDILIAPPCYSGFNCCAITPLGKVLPCNQLLLGVGDLTKESFQEIWQNSPTIKWLRNLTIRDLKKCSGCELLRECARCPGLALLEGGGMLEASPENCRITKMSHLIAAERR